MWARSNLFRVKSIYVKARSDTFDRTMLMAGVESYWLDLRTFLLSSLFAFESSSA